jgi:hypothetical protein
MYKKVLLTLLALAVLAFPAQAMAGAQVTKPKFHRTTGATGQCDIVSSTEPSSYYFIVVTSNARCAHNGDFYDAVYGTCHPEELYIGYFKVDPHYDTSPGMHRYSMEGCRTHTSWVTRGAGLYTGITRYRIELPPFYRWNLGPNYYESNPGYRELRTGPDARVLILTAWSRWST